MTQAKRPQQGNVPGKIWSDLLTAKRCGHGFDPKIIVKKYVFRSKQQRCVREWSTTMDTRYISLLFVVCHLHAICNTLNYGTRGLLFANQSQKSHQNWCQIIKVQSKSENSRQKKQTRKPLEQLLFSVALTKMIKTFEGGVYCEPAREKRLGWSFLWSFCRRRLWRYRNHQWLDGEVEHTSYLSRTPRTCPCKFFLAGVNFYRFNAKNWQFTVYLLCNTQ